MCTILLPPGDKPIAVNKYHNKCPPPVPILSQLDPVHTLKSQFLKIHLNPPIFLILSMPGSSKWSLSLTFSHQKPCIRLLEEYGRTKYQLVGRSTVRDCFCWMCHEYTDRAQHRHCQNERKSYVSESPPQIKYCVSWNRLYVWSSGHVYTRQSSWNPN
jgi:hypothetical protein